MALVFGISAFSTKHFWLSRPGASLRLLKSKYFPHGNLTDTAFPKVTSPSWQGIQHGLDLLKEGIIWRVGSGSKIQIWRDNWVPRGNLKISAPVVWSRLRRVADLIIPGTNLWNEPLIRSLFFPFDADEILKIRLPPPKTNDFIAWHFEKTGSFSVRSAYRLALNLKQNLSASGTSAAPDGHRNLWRLIWRAPVPPKIRIFAWKLATYSLAIQANRHHRHMDALPTCSICGMEAEDGFHAVMTCTKARYLRDCQKEMEPPARTRASDV